MSTGFTRRGFVAGGGLAALGGFAPTAAHAAEREALAQSYAVVNANVITMDRAQPAAGQGQNELRAGAAPGKPSRPPDDRAAKLLYLDLAAAG